MEKIINVFTKVWNGYRNWLGDVVWYKNWKVWLSVAVIFVVGMTGDSEENSVEAEEQETEVVAEVEQKEPEEELEEVEEEVSTQDVITNTAKKVLGDKFIDIEYMDASDHYNIYSETSGLTANMDRKSTYFDTSNILEQIQSEEFGSLYFEYQAEFVDDYGDSEQRKGITYDLTKETVDKINFSSFLPEKLPDIADSYWEHPAFSR